MSGLAEIKGCQVRYWIVGKCGIFMNSIKLVNEG